MVALALALALGGCGAGPQAQTSDQVTMTLGAEGRVGTILVRDAAFTYDRPVPGDTVYRPGEDATLQVTIINDASGRVAGMAPDRLVSVSSPIATSGRIVGDARIPDGQVLTAGYSGPVSSITLPNTTAVEITLVDLTSPLRVALTYPVVFTFERAGDLRLEVPVENPHVLPPRAEDATSEGRELETGPEVGPIPPVAPR